MNWMYVILAVNSIGTIVAVAYALAARRTAAKRKRRNKLLRKRLASAEIAAGLAPRAATPGTSQARYAGTPLEPLRDAVCAQGPWVPDHPDILPDANCDLSEFDRPVTRPKEPAPDGAQRRDIEVLRHRLEREFRGLPQLVLLNALTIAYLRRNTEHTAKARALFLRLWAERAEDIAPHLSPRWLVSTLRTFQEHGETDDQRLIGATGSLYGYMQRIYESERAMAGLQPEDAYVRDDVPEGAFGFPGIATTTVRHNDSMCHVHTLLVDISLLDHSAGRVLEELLIRSYHAPNVFQRADRQRAQMFGQNAEAQSAHWAFLRPRA